MIKYLTQNNIKIAIAESEDLLISETQDAVDLLGEVYMEGCSRIVVFEKNLHPGFFKLSTGLAGDILQKFSNYRIKLAIVGDFTKYKSKSLKDFIRESNKGNSVFFVESIDIAKIKLSGK
jgi:hypothetical protein